MKLHFGSLYWPTTWPDAPRYPSLSGTADCEALIVGGGMSGSVCGLTLARSGIDAVLVERDAVASGSSAANTGLIQYSNDIMLSQLAQRIGEKKAALFYRSCKEAAEHLALLAESLPRDVEFKRRSSLYYATGKEDVPSLREEFAMLDRNGFGAEWWDGGKIAAEFPFRKEAAIVTHGDAELNPYKFVCSAMEEAAAQGLAVYEHTPLMSVEGEKGRFVARTERGTIRAKNIVYAVGYAPEEAKERSFDARLNRSYAIATKPLPALEEWHQRFMLWETARPYLYARTTADGRIVAGGFDEEVRQPVSTEAELHQRSLRLRAELRKLFPDLEPEVEYEWCATFGESGDDLPWLGEDAERPGIYYCLGYGGNGSIYSLIAAGLIRDAIAGDAAAPVARIVRPDRASSKAAAQAPGLARG